MGVSSQVVIKLSAVFIQERLVWGLGQFHVLISSLIYVCNFETGFIVALGWICASGQVQMVS